ncbi:MAG: nucleotidyltransferase [Negativicutes bacterium]|nr:nucleotidyltransferase [Negativicutes bacterium]
MQAIGIIAEYNPFHNGHRWHLDQSRAISGQDLVIAVMSGHFVQRGEPAAFDKWTRAEMAVSAGVDLVLELPAVFAVRSAEYFATGGIRLLQSLGVVDRVAFGAENADLEVLSAIADAVDDPITIEYLKLGLESGETYAKALGRALARKSGAAAAVIAAPNNILAIEYIRAIRRFAPRLCPLPIPRRGVGHHEADITGPIASATAIRQALADKTIDQEAICAAMPAFSASSIKSAMVSGRGPVFFADFDQMLLAKLRSMPLADLADLPDVNEGLQNKIKAAALQVTTARDLLSNIKSKRYSHTRLQRILIHALLGCSQSRLRDFDATGPLYARVLAFSDRGRTLLRQLSRTSDIPVITKTTRFLNSSQRDSHSLTPLQAMLAVDTLATDLYMLAMPNPQERLGGGDFRTSPRYL